MCIVFKLTHQLPVLFHFIGLSVDNNRCGLVKVLLEGGKSGQVPLWLPQAFSWLPSLQRRPPTSTAATIPSTSAPVIPIASTTVARARTRTGARPRRGPWD